MNDDRIKLGEKRVVVFHDGIPRTADIVTWVPRDQVMNALEADTTIESAVRYTIVPLPVGS
jgi:hypothetical protein